MDGVKIMKYYKLNNEVFAYEEDGSQDHLIGDKVLMTSEEVEAHINPPKTEAQIQSEFRAERNKLLSEADILINKALDNDQDVTSLRTYRQALRDATIEWIMPNLEDYLNVSNS